MRNGITNYHATQSDLQEFIIQNSINTRLKNTWADIIYIIKRFL